MTINITCTSTHIWKNIYGKHKHNDTFCFHNKPYWAKVSRDRGSYELTYTIRVSYDGLNIDNEHSYDTLGLFESYIGWHGLSIKVAEEDTYTELVNGLARYVLQLMDNYLN